MFRALVPVSLAVGVLLSACQSTAPRGTAGGGVQAQESSEQAIRRIERDGAMQRFGRGP